MQRLSCYVVNTQWIIKIDIDMIHGDLIQMKQGILEQYPYLAPWPEDRPYEPEQQTIALVRELYGPTGLNLIMKMNVDEFIAYCSAKGPGVLEALAYCGHTRYPIETNIKFGHHTITRYATMGFSHNLHINPSTGEFYQVKGRHLDEDGNEILETEPYKGSDSLKPNIRNLDSMSDSRIHYGESEPGVKVPIAYDPLRLKPGDAVVFKRRALLLCDKVVAELATKGYSEILVAPSDLQPYLNADGSVRQVEVTDENGMKVSRDVCAVRDALLFMNNPFNGKLPLSVRVGAVIDTVNAFAKYAPKEGFWAHLSEDDVLKLGFGESVDIDGKQYRFNLFTRRIEPLDNFTGLLPNLNVAVEENNVALTKEVSQSRGDEVRPKR